MGGGGWIDGRGVVTWCTSVVGLMGLPAVGFDTLDDHDHVMWMVAISVSSSAAAVGGSVDPGLSLPRQVGRGRL